jgi:omega-6 fatty acid desaturase (delta-12 desaturase)
MLSRKSFAPPLLRDFRSNPTSAHCYHRSALRSSTYVVRDVVAISILVYGAYHIESFLSRLYVLCSDCGVTRIDYPATSARPLSPLLRSLSTLPTLSSLDFSVPVFGSLREFSAIYGEFRLIISHECGHQSYSSSKRINNFVGWVLHSILLVPYHSWRISVRGFASSWCIWLTI